MKKRHLLTAIFLQILAFVSFASFAPVNDNPQPLEAFTPHYILPASASIVHVAPRNDQRPGVYNNTSATKIFVGTTYYFAAAGSTSNTGLSASSPWPLSKVATTGVPGDNLLFQKGDTFSGTINYANSGSNVAPITFDLYGNATNNAVIDGGGTSSAPVLTINANYITVNNLVIQNNAHANGVVYLPSGVHDIAIYNCYINTGIRGVYAHLSGSAGVADITVLHCWFASISDNSTHSNGGGSDVQLNGVNGSGVEIAYNNCFTDMTLTATQRLGVGDRLNLYQCNGTSASPMLVHDNNVRGGSSYAPGEAGLILGDVGGSYQSGYNNIFIQSGAVGCQVQGGHDINMSNNQLYSPSYSYTFNGLAFANYSGVACYNITMGGNVINWRNGNNGGGAIQNYYQDNSGNSTSTGVSGGAALAVPTNWATNTAYSTAGAVTDASLPNPLWTGSPWNTSTSGQPIPIKGKKIIQL